LLRFLEDLYTLEYEVIRVPKGKFVIVDYGVRQNPLLEEAQLKEEKTIEEMQATVFDARYYEYINETNKMFFFGEPAKKGGKGVPVEGPDFEGLGLRRSEVISHIRELRSLGYQILNTLIVGNSRTCKSLVTQLSTKFSVMLITDSLTLGFLSPPDANAGIDSASFEALDLLLNLCSIKDLFT